MRNKRKGSLALLWCTVLLSDLASATIITGNNTLTGLRNWTWREAGISVQLVQRLPAQTRGFFQGRGFTSAQSDTIAKTCVLQTIFRNDGKQPLRYDLDNWRITYQGTQRPLLTRKHWNKYWQDSKATPAARIALRWSLLPTRQQFEPGDYNWGMISFGLPPGASFDLSLRLTINKTPITRSIPGIVCATDLQGN